MTRPIGRGWATVDLERAERELRDLPAPGSTFEDAPRSSVLGARCRRARGPSDKWIVILEPDAEGRIAGFLARHGEGWAATWEPGEEATMAPIGRPRAGPLGPEILAADQPTTGPYWLIVTPATIDT